MSQIIKVQQLSLTKPGQHEVRRSLLKTECSSEHLFLTPQVKTRVATEHSGLKLVLLSPAWSAPNTRFSSLQLYWCCHTKTKDNPTELEGLRKAKTSAAAGPWLGISGQTLESKSVGISIVEGQCQQELNK